MLLYNSVCHLGELGKLDVGFSENTKVLIKDPCFKVFLAFMFLKHVELKSTKNNIEERKHDFQNQDWIVNTGGSIDLLLLPLNYLCKMLLTKRFCIFLDIVSVNQVCHICAHTGMCHFLMSWFSLDFIYLCFVIWEVILQALINYYYFNIVNFNSND